jgi:hypothetical protein
MFFDLGRNPCGIHSPASFNSLKAIQDCTHDGYPLQIQSSERFGRLKPLFVASACSWPSSRLLHLPR